MKQMQGINAVRKTTIIGAVVLLVALVAAWMFVLSPRSDAIAKANDEVATAQQSNQALRAQIATLHSRQEQLPELRKVSQALDRRFPPSAEQAKLYKMITSAAAAAGIAPQFVTGVIVDPPAAVGSASSAQLPGVAMPMGQIAGQKVTINTTASPSQVRAFVANLEKLPRAFAVDTISLTQQTAAATGTGTATGVSTGTSTPNVDPNSQTVTITGDMFVMPSVVDPTAASTVG
jgi:Tfp pilus assembly protein PilO